MTSASANSAAVSRFHFMLLNPQKLNIMKTREIIAYRNGLNWEINDDGHIGTLPYYVKTKKDVREYLVNGNDNPAIIIKVIFAK